LRDSLHSQELAQVAEVRLFELFENNPGEFLGHPRIAANLPEVLTPLPDVLQRLLSSDEKLLGVLVCFAYASRERDRHLVQFRDAANNRGEKEALGALFSDPNLASTQGAVLFQRRQDADTIFASMAALEPYDKAQALLYFMGHRGFFSPIEDSLENDRFNTPVGNSDTPLIPKKSAPGVTAPGVAMPDVLIRAQKAFGITIDTAENLKAGLLNERTLTELLREALYGRNGLASEPDLLEKFFTLAGRTLIQQNPQLAALKTEQKKKLAAFLGFAFANCPESRLPSVILKVWEASKGDNKDAPALVATIFSKLGSAFVKFGQRLAQLNIDAEYKRAFRKLCSENTKVDTSFVYHNLSITCPPGTFDESCTGRKIAEGSMAATFEGTLRDSGKKVCIKMIHPSIRGYIDQDIDYISTLVEYINREQTFPGLSIPANTPEIVRQQLTEQVDTGLEMERTEHLRNALQSPKSGAVTFVVPEVLQDVSGEGTIVYDLLPSYELDKEDITSQDFDARAISHEVGLEILRMLVEEKYYQSDVNLGNFGVLKDPKSGKIVCTKDHRPTVVWYDAGAVQEIAPEDQKLLLQIVLAAARNPAQIPDLVSTLVCAEGASAKQVHAICRDFGEKLKGSGKLDLTRLQEQLQEFIDALAEAGFTVQDKWLVIANTLSMAAPFLRGVDAGRLTDLFAKAMLKHKLISTSELLAMRFMSVWK
jgi:predicted unusual protein kinase regulating ubiquinone biosynthesis (AarF/ABC1/UbiB family)